MSEVAGKTGTAASRPEQSTKEQAKEKVQDVTSQVQDKAGEMKGQVGSQLRSQVDTRTTQAGTQLSTTASAMRRTGEKLREEGNSTDAKVVEGIADRAERLGGYMKNVDSDKLLRDVEDFGRRQPWLLALGGSALGFLASRFMKASSSQRYSGGSGGAARGLPQGQPATGYGALDPSDLDAPSTRESHDHDGIQTGLTEAGPKQTTTGASRSQRSGTSGRQ